MSNTTFKRLVVVAAFALFVAAYVGALSFILARDRTELPRGEYEITQTAAPDGYEVTSGR